MDVFSAEIDIELFDRVLGNTRSLARPSLDEAVAEQIVQNLRSSRAARCCTSVAASSRRTRRRAPEFADLARCPSRTA